MINKSMVHEGVVSTYTDLCEQGCEPAEAAAPDQSTSQSVEMTRLSANNSVSCQS